MLSNTEQVNVPETISKKDVRCSWLRWTLGIAMSTSVERLQALAFCASISPILEKLYKTKDTLSAALKRHLLFFNTQGNWGAIIPGAVIAMEEQKAITPDLPEEAITGFKTGMMGPMAGIGDTLDWLTLGPLLIALFLPAAMEGSWVAALMPLILFTIPTTIVSYSVWHLGYKSGKQSIKGILESGKISQLIEGASILGLFMMGALSASFVKVSTPLVYTANEQTFALQTVFDNIFPGFLPLLLIAGVYLYLEKAGPKYMRVLLGLLVIGIVLGTIGIL